MLLSVHQPQYIPWLGYFDKIDKSDCFVFLDQVQYKHREYQNRNKIRTKDGWGWLTVPVVSKGLGRQKICDVKIQNDSVWQKKHWASLKNCYNKAPFFKKHYHFFESVYSVKWQRLIDLNIHIIKYLLKELEIKTPFYYESKIGTSSQGTDRIIEICNRLKADNYLSGRGGRAYLEEEKFSQAGIKLHYQDFTHSTYHQLYAKGNGSFLPNMSAVDLLFNEGEKSTNVLRAETYMKGFGSALSMIGEDIKEDVSLDVEEQVKV